MSSLVVEVCRIQKVSPHPNADRLALAQIKGWQCVIPKDKYKEGDLVTYIPVDSVVPAELSDRIGITKYLANGRVKCAKLRGEPSFGVVMDVENLEWSEGTDVREHYGITKYVPPVKFQAGDATSEHPAFARYTSIENMRNFPNVFESGDRVSVSEKIHGCNSRVALIRDNGEILKLAGSHRQQRKPDDVKSSMFWLPWSVPGVESLMNFLIKDANQVILFGEIFGKVQSLRYGQEGLAYAAFDLMVDGRYYGSDYFRQLCGERGVPVVPVMYDGLFDINIIKQLAEGQSTMPGADHIREGVVVRPATEFNHPKIGRAVLKYVGDGYLFGNESDSDDV